MQGSAPVLFSSVFAEHLPYYLHIGMTPTEFWEGDCALTKSYREAYKLKVNERNRELWLQGLYIYEALCDVSPVLQAFAKRGTKPREYLKEPIALTKEEIEERRIRDEKRKFEELKARISTWAANTNIALANNAVKEVSEDVGSS